MWKSAVTAVVSAFLVYYFYLTEKHPITKENERLENVLNGLLVAENSASLSLKQPIAVGFGSCLDLLVDGIPLLNSLGIPPPTTPKYHEVLKSLDDLSEMFAFYMMAGAAVERYIPQQLLKELVAVAEHVNHSRWAGGGNAPVIGDRFARDGYTNVHIGAQASSKLKSFFPSLSFSDSSDDKGDIHLILEYKSSEKWGNYTAVRANRFIVHSDQDNPYIKSLDSFHKVIKQVKPRLVIVSALQMLDNFPFESGVREARMASLREMLHDAPVSTLLHFEMASFSEVEMMRSILQYVLPYVDSAGMNEQELPNLISMLKHGTVVEVANSNPRTAHVLDDMRELYKLYLKNSVRGLSRIHVHTLAFQAILLKDFSPWKNIIAGAARASLTAHRHVCGVKEIAVENTKLIMDDSFSVSAASEKRIYFSETSPISCWREDEYEICVAPVLVCTHVKQTVGGGDNITPAGLMPQI